MLASRVLLKDLTTFQECDKAIKAIEGNRKNYYGDLAHWLSGRETILKVSAKKKIDSINRKIERLTPEEED